jgi:hypothetical protein
MWTLGTPAIELVIRALLVYFLFFAALRLFGKREIGQFTLFDLALVLLVANALQPAVTGPDDSITGGAIVIVTLFAIDRVVAFARVRSKLVRRISSSGRPCSGATAPGSCRFSLDRAWTWSTWMPRSASTAWTTSRR